MHGTWRLASCDAGVQAAVSIDPEFGEAYAGLGAALGNQFFWSLAVEAHARAAVLLPDDVVTMFNLGVAFGELSRPHDAEDCFRRVLAARPRDAETLLRLSAELAEQGRWFEAENEARSAIDAEPNGMFAASAWASLAFLLARMERTPEARSALKRARDLQPSIFDDRVDVAQLWKELGGS